MDVVRLAVMGVGSLRAAPPVLAAISTYFGERPLQICLYDADQERLELMERFLSTSCSAGDSNPIISATEDAQEALENAERIILMVGENCARKHFRPTTPVEKLAGLTREEVILRWFDEVFEPGDAFVLNLIRSVQDLCGQNERCFAMSWPAELNEEERMRLPHQVLRWAKSTEPVIYYLEEQSKSPIKTWLDNPALIQSKDFETTS